MASTLNFGPQWLRTLSDSGAGGGNAAAGPSLLPQQSSQPHSFAPVHYKLAEHRYGREEMLALYTASASSVTVDLSDTSLMLPKPLPPLALVPMSEEEQTLLLQNVNSTVSMKTFGGRGSGMSGGGGMQSMRGRGDSDRGRGRGRGRDDENFVRRPRDPWEEGYSRGGGRSYDRGGYHGGEMMNGPPISSNRDNISRSMSTENWREAKSAMEEDGEAVRRGGGAERGGGGLGGGSRGWGPQRGWRETREPMDRRPPNDYDPSRSRYPPPQEDSGRRIEYRRSRSSGSAMQDDEPGQDVPEWSTVNAEEIESGGFFDGSGAFLYSKDNARARKASSDVDLTARKGGPPDGVGGGSRANEILDSSGQFDDHGKPPSTGGGSSNSTSRVPPATGEESVKNVNNNKQLRADDSNRGSSNATAAADGRGGGSGRTVSGGPSKPGNHPGGGGSMNSAVGSSVPVSSASPAVENGNHVQSRSQNVAPPGKNAGDSSSSPWSGADQLAKQPASSNSVASGNQQQMPVTVATQPVSAAPQPQTVPPAMKSPPPLVEDQWYYRDPQGEIQGPFKNSEMAEWFSAGFFTMSLDIKAGPTGSFTTLGELISMYGHIPFTASSVPPAVPAPLPVPTATVQPSVMAAGSSLMMEPAMQEQMKLLQQQQLAAAVAAQQQFLLSQQLQMMHAQQLSTAGSLAGTLPPMHGLPGGQLPPLSNPLYSQQLMQNLMPGSSLLRPNTDVRMPTSNGSTEPPQSIWNIDPGTQMQMTSSSQGREDETAAAAQREREEMERRRAEQERAARAAEQERAEAARRAEQERIEAARRAQQEQEQRRRMEEQQRKKEEEERRQREEADRRRAAEAEERKRQEMLRLKREEEERMREEQRQIEERQEWQRQEELIRRQEQERLASAAAHREKQRLEAAQQATKPAPWLNATAASGGGGGSNSMQQIQRVESDQLRVELAEAERQRMVIEEQMRQMEMIQRQKQQQASSWKDRAPAPAPAAMSLLEIQLEQERQLADERNRQLEAAKLVAPDLPLGMAAVWSGSTAPLRRDNYGGGSGGGGGVWESMDSGFRPKTLPAATGALNAQFPALPTAAKKQQQQQPNKVQPKTVTKTKKEEATVQKLFESTSAKDDFTKWCSAVLQGLETSVDIPTLVEFLKDIESPYEVQDYITSYLGDSKQVQVFAQQFLEKRSKMRNAAKPKQEGGLWGPAPALNPQLSRQQQTSSSVGTKPQHAKQQQQGSKQQQQAPAPAAGGGGKKKKKMQKVDSSVLGFTVIADPTRTNMGELDKV